MTRRTQRFVWIDDNPVKFEKYKTAIENEDVKGCARARVDLREVGASVLDTIEELEGDKIKPSLILMDHIFIPSHGTSLRINGASAAHLVRRAWPDVPIVCVTAILPAQPGKLDQEDLSEYVDVFPHGELGDRVEMLFAIARDFKKLSPARITNYRQHLITQLKPPASERDALMRALPDEFQSQAHATTQHRVANWIVRVFMKRPGFLYDSLRAATLVGLSKKGFSKFEDVFAPALYRGPFATQSQPLWWVSTLTKIVFAKTGNVQASSPQLAGRGIERVTPADYSRCYVNRPSGDIPDTVARLSPSKEIRAVSSKHTRRDPADAAALPGFEALQVIES